MCVGKNDGGKPGSNDPTPSRGFDIKEIGNRIGEFFGRTGQWFSEQKDRVVEFANRPETQERIQTAKTTIVDMAKALGSKISDGIQAIQQKLNQKDSINKPDKDKPPSEPKETAKFVVTLANINSFNRMYGGEHSKPVDVHSYRLSSRITQEIKAHGKAEEAKVTNGKDTGSFNEQGKVIVNRSAEAEKARDESFKSRDFFQDGERRSPFEVRQELIDRIESKGYTDKQGRDISAGTCTAYVHNKPDIYSTAISKIESINPDMKTDDLRGSGIKTKDDIYGKADKPLTEKAVDSRPESSHKINVELAKSITAVLTTDTRIETGKAVASERSELGFKAFEEKGLTPSEASIYREFGVISEENAVRSEIAYHELKDVAEKCENHSIDEQIEKEKADMPASLSDSMTPTELKVELILGNIDKTEYDAKISEIEQAKNDEKMQEENGKQIEIERGEIGKDYFVGQLAKSISFLSPAEIKIELESGRMSPEECQTRYEIYQALEKLDTAVVRADYADLEAVKDAISRDEGKNVLTGFPDDQNPQIIPEKCSDEGRAWYEQSQMIKSQSPDSELRLYTQIAAADTPTEQLAKIEELTLAYNNHADIVEQHADKLLELVHEFRRK